MPRRKWEAESSLESPKHHTSVLLSLHHASETVTGTWHISYLILHASLHRRYSYCVSDEESQAWRGKNNLFKIIFLEGSGTGSETGSFSHESRAVQHLKAENSGWLRVRCWRWLASSSSDFLVCKWRTIVPTSESFVGLRQHGRWHTQWSTQS